MRLISPRKILVAGILAIAVCGVPLFNSVPSWIPPSNASLLGLVLASFQVPSPVASALAGEAAIDALAMMANAPRDLQVEQFDSF